MSYILDALKKANAEREQGRSAAPGLHTQPVRDVSQSTAQTGWVLKKRTALMLALATALFLCVATIGALFWSPLNTSSRLSTPVPLSPPQTDTTRPIAANTGPTNPATMTAPAGPPPVLTDTVRVTPAPYSSAQTTPAPPTKPGTPSISPRPRPATTPPPSPSPLPASVRAALPPMVISGSTFSDNPAYRMLIINGQVYREGEFPAPDLKLEQIRPKSALLHYKGTTYVLPY